MAEEIERDPDKRQASGGFYVEDRQSDVICVLRVQRFGALVIRGRCKSEPWSHGVSIFTDEDIKFD